MTESKKVRTSRRFGADGKNSGIRSRKVSFRKLTTGVSARKDAGFTTKYAADADTSTDEDHQIGFDHADEEADESLLGAVGGAPRPLAATKHRYWRRFFHPKDTLTQIRALSLTEDDAEEETKIGPAAETEAAISVSLTPAELVQAALSIIVGAAALDLSSSSSSASFSTLSSIEQRRKFSARTRREDLFSVSMLRPLLDLLEHCVAAAGLNGQTEAPRAENENSDTSEGGHGSDAAAAEAARDSSVTRAKAEARQKKKREMVSRVLRCLFQTLHVAIRKLGPNSVADVSLVVMTVLHAFPQPLPASAAVFASELLRGVLWAIQRSFECLPMNPTFIAAAASLIHDFDTCQGPYFFVQVLQV